MVKRKVKQTQTMIVPQNSKLNSKPNQQSKLKKISIESVTENKIRSAKPSSKELRNSNFITKKMDQLSRSDEQQQKSEFEIPTKLKKKISKKKKRKSSKGNSKSKNLGVKLQRGYKYCQNCQTVLNIHKYVCTQCGFVHNMKKHKFDVMKNLSKATPKIVKSIIESNQFNMINLNVKQEFISFESSFELKDIVLNRLRDHSIVQQKLQNKMTVQEVKRKKSQGKNEKNKSYKFQLINQKDDNVSIQTSKMNKIAFKQLKIKKGNQFSTKINEKEENSNHVNQFNKTREQFSIYKSQYPIICMQGIDIPKNQQINGKSHQYLLFTESVSKNQFFSLQTQNGDILSSNGNHMKLQNQNSEMVDEYMIDKKSLLKKQQLMQQKIKQEQDKTKMQKLRQNNLLTEKALNLGKYQKIGALYNGQTILNIMSLQTKSKLKDQQIGLNKEQLGVEQQVKRRSSSRSLKTMKNKADMEMQNAQKIDQNKQNQRKDNKNSDQYNVLRIGLKQHVQMLKTVNNKVAILTGRKNILLINLNIYWEDIFQQRKQISYKQSGENQQNKDNILFWLQNRDFQQQNYECQNVNNYSKSQQKSKRYLSSISLSKQGAIKSQDDQFTVIQWLKNQYLYDNTHQNKHHDTYLVTGTMYGHIIIYKVSPQNHYTTYRTIIGAHFEMINCLSQCPLNINGTALFASASYDGSVKIWQLNHTQPISQFQVSNRKIQSIHWDTGAKFLLIVRDQGLQNCYLACFYSVNNRIQLPMMLTDTIDFRLIRNGLMFDNSCSPLITFPLNSKLVLMLNSRNGFLKILESQELRKTSLKRKKSKKNYQQLLYHDYWIRMGENQSTMNNKSQQNTREYQSPQIIQMKSNCTDYINYAYAAKEQLQIQQDQPMSINSIVPQQINLNNGSQSDLQQDQFKSQSSHQLITIKDTSKKPIKTKPLPQPQPVGIRKSLRVRKPIIQYNFMQEEQNQSQKSIQNQKPKSTQKNKNKKKLSSDDQDFQNQSSDQSQQIQNLSDQSFQNKPNQTNLIKQNSNKHPLQTKNKPKRQNAQKQNLMKKSLRSRDQKKQMQSKKSESEQMLYKLFWQETNEQSLVNRKQDFPCNKFPKFSAIVSFLTVQGQSQIKIQQKQEKQVHQMREINKDQNYQKSQIKSEYLTSFIAGYNGELIRVKIKIEGYHQSTQEKPAKQDSEKQSD